MSKLTSFLKFLGFYAEAEEVKPKAIETDTEKSKATRTRSNSSDYTYGKKSFQRKYYKHIDQTIICKRSRDPSKKDLILDLDNTLICALVKPPSKRHYMIKVEKEDTEQIYYVLPRPGLIRALNKLIHSYNISVFTAGASMYARRMIHALGIGDYIYGIYDRESCGRTSEGKLTKNIWDFNFEREKTIFVDDSAFHVSNHEENGLHIKPFFGEKMDRELLKVADFLDSIANLEDVRPVAKNFENYLYESKRNYEEEMIEFQQQDGLVFSKVESEPLMIEEGSDLRRSQECPTIQSL